MARRKFHDLHVAQPSPLITQALGQIGELYAVEQQIRSQAPELRQQYRQTHSLPVLEKLHEWMSQTLCRLSQKSSLAQAIRYALNRWEALCAYAYDGRAEIDNNAAERALRTVAPGSQELSVRRLRCGRHHPLRRFTP